MKEIKTVTITTAHNEHGTPIVKVTGPDLTPLEICQPPQVYLDAVAQAYNDNEWAKLPRDDLGNLPSCSIDDTATEGDSDG